jgi:hypothetical protein
VPRGRRPFAGAFDPVTQTLDKGIADVLGVLEGWARATQAKDGASHVFRFGATVSPYTFSQLAALLDTAPTARRNKSGDTPRTPLAKLAPKLDGPAAKLPAVRLPKVPEVQLPKVVRDLTRKLGLDGSDTGSGGGSNAPAAQLLDYLLK